MNRKPLIWNPMPEKMNLPLILKATSCLLNDENYRLDFERKAKQYFNEHLYLEYICNIMS